MPIQTRLYYAVTLADTRTTCRRCGRGIWVVQTQKGYYKAVDVTVEGTTAPQRTAAGVGIEHTGVCPGRPGQRDRSRRPG